MMFAVHFVYGQSLAPAESESLYKHLLEINKEWQHYATDLKDKESFRSFAKDEERIQLHLQLVHKTLDGRSTAHLSERQKINRKHHLEVLSKYWKEAVFPRNNRHDHRKPYFVDDNGNACAVGYLMEEDGQNELVDLISQKDNYKYLSELVEKYPVIKSWSDDNGLL